MRARTRNVGGTALGASGAAPIGTTVTIRALRTQKEYAACVELQEETWGRFFSERVPASLLQVCQRIGGVAAGAFDDAGRLLGFVFGITGVMDGALVHWSDMLAVDEAAQGLGIGRRLKEFQRDYLLQLGVEVVYWTYDPLVARNAHLNLNRLGAEVVEYVPEMYGASDSVLHRGLGTDRFVVAWRIGENRTQAEFDCDPSRFEATPVANGASRGGDVPLPVGSIPEAVPAFRVEVPLDIQQIKDSSPETAVAWRHSTREVFLAALERGYRVLGFYRDPATDRCFYALALRTSGKDG